MGREVFSLVRAQCVRGADWHIEGFVDDAPDDRNQELVRSLGSKILGPVDSLSDLGEVNAVIAVGAPAIRADLASQFSMLPITWPTMMHPDATIGMNVACEIGVIVAAGARLSVNIAIGKHVHIDQNAAVGHDAVIEDYARVNPQACISGGVTIGQGALVGANATVLQGLRVGAGAVVGAGACVVTDVSDGTTVKGIPAR